MLASRLRALSRDTLVYGLASAGSRLVSVLLTPILARALDPAEFGVADLVASAVSIVTIVLTFGLDTAVGLLYYERDDAGRARLAGTAVSFLGLASLGAALVLVVAADPVAAGALDRPAYAPYFRIAMAGVPGGLLVFFLGGLLRLAHRPRAYAALAVGHVALTAALTILLVAGAGLGVAGVFWATLVANPVAALGGLLLARGLWRPSLHRPDLGALLGYGLPLVPAGVATWTYTLLNRYLLDQLAGPHELGLYAMAARLSMVVGMLAVAFQLAWGPFALAIADQPDARATYARVLSLFTAIGVAATLGLTLLAPEIIAVFATSSYVGAAPAVGILGLATVASGAYYVVAIGVNVARRTSRIAWTTGLAAVASVALNLLLIPRLGIIGAALATLAAHYTSAAALYLVAQRAYHVPFRLGEIHTLLLVGIALAAVGQLAAWPTALDLPIRLALVAAFPILALPILRLRLADLARLAPVR